MSKTQYDAIKMADHQPNYTEIASGLIEDDVDKAIAQWYAHRQNEIESGRAKRALAVFKNIDVQHLKEKGCFCLSFLLFIRNRHAEALDTLDLVEFTDLDVQLEMYSLRGQIEIAENDLDAAEQSYESGLALAEKSSTTYIPLFRAGIVAILGERVQHYDALEEVDEITVELQRCYDNDSSLKVDHSFLRRDCDIKCTLSQLAGRSRDLPHALSFLDDALDLAERSNYLEGKARVHMYLGNIKSLTGELDNAVVHIEIAQEIYKYIGRAYMVYLVKTNYAYNLYAYDFFEEAIQEALELETYAISNNNLTREATAASILCDAYFRIGEVEQAKEIAMRFDSRYQQDGEYFIDELDTIGYGLRTLGLIYKSHEDYEQAKYHLEHVCEMAIEYDFPDLALELQCRTELKEIYEQEELVDKAAEATSRISMLSQELAKTGM